MRMYLNKLFTWSCCHNEKKQTKKKQYRHTFTHKKDPKTLTYITIYANRWSLFCGYNNRKKSDISLCHQHEKTNFRTVESWFPIYQKDKLWLLLQSSSWSIHTGHHVVDTLKLFVMLPWGCCSSQFTWFNNNILLQLMIIKLLPCRGCIPSNNTSPRKPKYSLLQINWSC